MNKKTIIITLIILALVVILTFQWCGSRRLYNKLSLAKGVEQTMTKQLEEKDKAYEELKKKGKAKESELNGNIDSANTVIANLEEEKEKGKQKIAEMEEIATELSTMPETLERVKKERDNYKSLSEQWKNDFDLSQNQLVGKDKVIFSINKKYENELGLRIKADGVIADFKKTIVSKDTLILNLEKSLAKKRFSLKMSRMFEVALIGVGGYLILKK